MNEWMNEWMRERERETERERDREGGGVEEVDIKNVVNKMQMCA